MNARRFALILTAAAALSPLTSQASPERDAVDSCAHALVASMAATGTAPPTYKVQYPSDRFRSAIAKFFVHDDTFELEARDRKSGAVIARARCTTNYRGSILAFSTVPLAEREALLSARR